MRVTRPKRRGMKLNRTRRDELVTQALTSIRYASGLTQRELAAKLKRDKNFVHYVERGRRHVSIAEFDAYADACGVDPIDLHRRIRSART